MTKVKLHLLPTLLLALTFSSAHALTAAPTTAQPTATLVSPAGGHGFGRAVPRRARVQVCDNKRACTIATLPIQVGKVNAILAHEFIKGDKTNGSFMTFSKKWVSMCYVAAHDATTTCAPLTRTDSLRNFSVSMGKPLPTLKADPHAGSPILFIPPRGRQISKAEYTSVARSMMQGIERSGKALAQHAKDHYLGRQPLASLIARPSSTGCESNELVGMICSNGNGSTARNSLTDETPEDDGDGQGGGEGGNGWPDSGDQGGDEPGTSPFPPSDDSDYPSDNNPPPTPLPDSEIPKVVVTAPRPEPSNDGPLVDIPIDMLPWDGSMCIVVVPGPMVCPGPPPIGIDPDHIVRIPGKRAEVPVKTIPIISLERIINTTLDWISRPKRASGDYGPVYEELARKCDDEYYELERNAYHEFNEGRLNPEGLRATIQRLKWAQQTCMARARQAQREANGDNSDDDTYTPLRAPVPVATTR